MIVAVLLAAGRSRRMGPDVGSKLLLPWGTGGEPMVAVVAATLRQAGIGRIVAVLGHGAPEVATALAPAGATTVHNPDYAQGLSTSLAAGVRAAGRARGYLFALGDMPAVRESTVRALLRAFDAAEPPAIVAPTHCGRRGNPVVFSGHFRDELLALQGDRGARALLAAHVGRVVEVAVDDAGISSDVDTPEGYRELREGGDQSGG